jgi:hypothetical protein
LIQHRPETKADWQRKFEDPIPLPSGRQLLTLKNAADYIMKLPKTESDLPEWQAAIEVLLLCSRSGPTMMARIAVMRALNRHVERVFNPDRKETHWGSGSSRGTNEGLLFHGAGRPNRMRHRGHDYPGNDTADFPGLRARGREGPMTVFVYVNTSKQVGDAEHVKVFATTDAAEKWFEENDPEGVAFEYEVLE